MTYQSQFVTFRNDGTRLPQTKSRFDPLKVTLPCDLVFNDSNRHLGTHANPVFTWLQDNAIWGWDWNSDMNSENIVFTFDKRDDAVNFSQFWLD